MSVLGDDLIQPLMETCLAEILRMAPDGLAVPDTVGDAIERPGDIRSLRSREEGAVDRLIDGIEISPGAQGKRRNPEGGGL